MIAASVGEPGRSVIGRREKRYGAIATKLNVRGRSGGGS